MTEFPERAAPLTVSVVLDCADPDGLARFWAPALELTEVGRDETFIGLRDLTGRRPTLVLQRVPEPRSGKNRMHIDIFTSTFADDLARLQRLGATVLVEPHLESDGGTLCVLADPEGNEFCLLSAPDS